MASHVLQLLVEYSSLWGPKGEPFQDCIMSSEKENKNPQMGDPLMET